MNRHSAWSITSKRLTEIDLVGYFAAGNLPGFISPEVDKETAPEAVSKWDGRGTGLVILGGLSAKFISNLKG